jgi:hypothetical protein
MVKACITRLQVTGVISLVPGCHGYTTRSVPRLEQHHDIRPRQRAAVETNLLEQRHITAEFSAS